MNTEVFKAARNNKIKTPEKVLCLFIIPIIKLDIEIPHCYKIMSARHRVQK